MAHLSQAARGKLKRGKHAHAGPQAHGGVAVRAHGGAGGDGTHTPHIVERKALKRMSQAFDIVVVTDEELLAKLVRFKAEKDALTELHLAATPRLSAAARRSSSVASPRAGSGCGGDKDKDSGGGGWGGSGGDDDDASSPASDPPVDLEAAAAARDRAALWTLPDRSVTGHPTPRYFMIHPSNPFKLYFDVFVAGLIVYSVLAVPFAIAFGDDEFAENLKASDSVIDGCFGVDIIITFRTAYFNELLQG